MGRTAPTVGAHKLASQPSYKAKTLSKEDDSRAEGGQPETGGFDDQQSAAAEGIIEKLECPRARELGVAG